MGKNNYNIDHEDPRDKFVHLGVNRAALEDKENRERAFWRKLFIADAKMEIENEKKKKGKNNGQK